MCKKCQSVFLVNEAVEVRGGSGGKGPQEGSSPASSQRSAVRWGGFNDAAWQWDAAEL